MVKKSCVCRVCVCVFHRFVFVLFGWFYFLVQLYFHTVEAYLLYPIYLSIWRVSLCSLSVLELAV